MVKKLSALIILTLFFSVFTLWAYSAEAARLGGGRSFGSKPSYQRSAPAPTSPQPGYQNPSQQASPVRPSPFGGMRGLFGGLLVGSLLGSLFMGGGFHGMGMIDILIIGFLLFLLFRFIRSRRAAYQSAGSSAYGQNGQGTQYSGTQYSGGQESGSIWDTLKGRGGQAGPAAAPASAPGPEVPAGFDSEDFLKGAKAAYVKLQEAWDRRDLNEIRHFASREVYEEIRSQAEHDPNPGKTELLMVNARLMEVKESGNETVATVFFDVLMRESSQGEAPKQTREVWHFSRDETKQSFWVLEGIQQVE